MDEFDFDFLSLTMGMVGLFFICCAIMQRKPKHILEELFGVYSGGLRHLKDSVFKKNQLVLGFVCIFLALIINIFSRSMAAPDGQGMLNAYNAIPLSLALIGLITALCAVLYYLCRVWSKWHFRQIVTEVVTEHRWPFESNVNLAVEIGKLLGLERKADVTVEEYLGQLQRFLELPDIPPEERRATRSSKIGLEFR